MAFSSPVPDLEFTSAAFVGRTFADYLRRFELQPGRLFDLSILDVAAGPSSFTAEARCAGLAVTAVDPLYGQPVEALRTHVQLDAARTDQPAQAAAAAAARFLADYEFGFIHGRYVGAALPKLPFPDRTFDLVLCGELLFQRAQSRQPRWTLAACCELARVCAGFVKIHPIDNQQDEADIALAELRRNLAGRGISSKVEGKGRTLTLCNPERAH